jgi:hypothetical protein
MLAAPRAANGPAVAAGLLVTALPGVRRTSLGRLKQRSTTWRAVGFPPGTPLRDRLPWPVPLRQITPRSPRPQASQHPLDHLSVITPRPSPTVQHRQQRSCPLPRRIDPKPAYVPGAVAPRFRSGKFLDAL